MTKVLKPFTTRLQKFEDGDRVAVTADLSPHTVESLAKGGFIDHPTSGKEAPKPAKSKHAE